MDNNVVRDFSCIEFLQKDGEDPYYDAVPSFWISKDEKSCRYPAVENVAMVKKLVKQYVKPEDTAEWKTVDISVHSTGYDTFKKCWDNAVRLTVGRKTVSASEAELDHPRKRGKPGNDDFTEFTNAKKVKGVSLENDDCESSEKEDEEDRNNSEMDISDEVIDNSSSKKGNEGGSSKKGSSKKGSSKKGTERDTSEKVIPKSSTKKRTENNTFKKGTENNVSKNGTETDFSNERSENDSSKNESEYSRCPKDMCFAVEGTCLVNRRHFHHCAFENQQVTLLSLARAMCQISRGLEALRLNCSLDSTSISAMIEQLIARPVISDTVEGRVLEENEIMGCLPFKTVNELKAFEEKLEKPEFALKAVKILKQQVPHNIICKTARGLVDLAFSDELKREYSLKGQKRLNVRKRAFVATKYYSSIIMPICTDIHGTGNITKRVNDTLKSHLSPNFNDSTGNDDEEEATVVNPQANNPPAANVNPQANNPQANNPPGAIVNPQ